MKWMTSCVRRDSIRSARPDLMMYSTLSNQVPFDGNGGLGSRRRLLSLCSEAPERHTELFEVGHVIDEMLEKRAIEKVDVQTAKSGAIRLPINRHRMYRKRSRSFQPWMLSVSQDMHVDLQ